MLLQKPKKLDHFASYMILLKGTFHHYEGDAQELLKLYNLIELNIWSSSDKTYCINITPTIKKNGFLSLNTCRTFDTITVLFIYFVIFILFIVLCLDTKKLTIFIQCPP